MSTRNDLQPLNEHNRRLRENVHPDDWKDPRPTGRYNLVVVGAGTAGLVTAAGAAALGAKVALIERDLMGGDCLNFGCVPSKSLLSAARYAATVQNAQRFGVLLDRSQVDFGAVMDRVHRTRADLSAHDSAHRFRSLGVDVYLGEGVFTGPDAIRVGEQSLSFRRAVIATGTRPATAHVHGLERVPYLTNESVFNLTELPRRMAIVGGGPVGSELAQAFARLGSQVTLMTRSAHVLPRDDQEAALVVQRSLQRDGVDVVLHAEATAVELSESGKRLHFTHDGNSESREVDHILLAVGRVPNVDALGLESARVEYDARQGVLVNDRLQTTNRRIFAAGDVCSSYRFTHAADFMARIAIRNALFFGRSKLSQLNIPWCTYTSPELAHVGHSLVSARARNLQLDTFTQPLERVDRAMIDDATDGFVRVHVRRGTDRIVGATIVSANAGELIGQVSLAMTHRLGLKELAATIFPYPTHSETLRQIGDQYNRTRLTPPRQAFLRRWFQILARAPLLS